MPLGLRWNKSQSSESLHLNRPRVAPCAFTVKSLPAMKNSSTQKLQPLCPEVYTLIAAWLFLWETIQMQDSTHDSKITHTTTPSPTTSALSDPGAIPSTSGVFPSQGTCHIANTHCTPNTLGTGKTCSTCDACDIRNTRHTSHTPDTHGTHDTCDTRGTRDTCSKAQECTHCQPRPGGADTVGSSSQVRQPESLATPSVLSQIKKGLAGKTQNFIVKHFCCRLPGKRHKNTIVPESTPA